MKLSALVAGLALTAPSSAQWSTDTLSQPRQRPAATSVGTQALFAGGFSDAGASAVVDVYDESTGAWSTDTLSAPRYDLVATSVAGVALFGGGTGSDIVDLYDSSTGTWSTATLPTRRDMAAASAGTQALFAGGGSAHTSYDRVDIWESTTNTWSTAALSQPRFDLAGTSVGDLVLFGGGCFSGTNSTRVDIYDTSTNTWSQSSLSQARTELAATSVAGKALFAGGWSGITVSSGTLRDRVDIYDAATGTWSIAGLSEARFGIAAATVGDLAIFAGGRGISISTPSDVVDIYDATTDTWSTATLSQARMRLSATGLADVALVAGGYSPSTGISAVVDVFDPQLGVRYCSPANVNSSGLSGLVEADGSPLASANDVTLFASRLPPGEFGYFITGLTQGLIQPPGSQGSICLAGNIGRYSRAGEIIQGPVGSLQIDLTSIPVNPPMAVLPGDTWNFQCWYRDSNPTPTSNTTNGLALTFATTGDPAVQFPETQARIVEDTTLVEVRITLSQATDQDVILPFVTGGTATVDVDWRVEEANPFVIPAGSTSADMTLAVAEDGLMEPDEVAIVSLAAPVGAVLGTATTFTLTIVDDD